MKRKLLFSSLSAAALLGAATFLTTAAVPAHAVTHDPNQGYNRVVHDVATVEAKNGAQLYSDPNSSVKTSRILPKGSRWKVSLILNNGMLWYKVGNNQWILATDADLDGNKNQTPSDNQNKVDLLQGVATVTYRTPIVVWANPGANPTGRYLPRNSSWRYFKVAQTQDGTNWYNLGGNQWVPQQYINFGQDPHIGHYTKPGDQNHNSQNNSAAQNGMVIKRDVVTINNTTGRGTYVLDRNGRSTGRLLPNGSKWRSFGYINNGEMLLNLGGNQWVLAYQTK